jgi:hypothetical protein
MSSVSLFQHYFVPRVVCAVDLARGVEFSLRDELVDEYLPEDLQERLAE